MPAPTKKAAVLQRGLAADGVRVEGVAAVDDDVALVHDAGEFLDDRVRGIAGLDHDDDLAWLLEAGHEVLDALGRDEGAVTAVRVEQSLCLGVTPVVHRDHVSVAGEVPRQVGPHDSEAGDTDLGER